MKKPLTRKAIDVDEAVDRYLDYPPKMQDLPDKLVDLIINGATTMSINKDHVRGLLRQTYAALKDYEKIGPMASPFYNDPSAIVALAFANLYPGIKYDAQLVQNIKDDAGGTAYGETVFPDDGSTPLISISAEAPISAMPELLAHELAHLVAPDDDHGEKWKAADDAIYAEYNRLIETMFESEEKDIEK